MEQAKEHGILNVEYFIEHSMEHFIEHSMEHFIEHSLEHGTRSIPWNMVHSMEHFMEHERFHGKFHENSFKQGTRNIP